MSDVLKENKLNLFNNLFKLLFLMFWVMFWFIGIILTDYKFNKIAIYFFISYSSVCIIYIISYVIYMKTSNNFEKKIEVFYKISTLLSFIFSTLSYYIFPISIMWFLIKLSLLFTYMYISILKVYKYKLEEGVVGILASALMLFMFLRY
ncbi:hypothetical protein QJS64_16565 [Paraclostridium bifermentans]|uniref:Uncharacterized protein n=2 Tax=Paraclostridium TaxID=1849822 RepID=A0ABY8R3Y2_PARBF|nr:hypothetical protein QJS64_16565 [Paraclostridium bifermentans]